MLTPRRYNKYEGKDNLREVSLISKSYFHFEHNYFRKLYIALLYIMSQITQVAFRITQQATTTLSTKQIKKNKVIFPLGCFPFTLYTPTDAFI